MNVPRTGKITFGSTASVSFSVGGTLDMQLFERASGFWKEKGLSIKRKEPPKPSINGDPMLVSTMLAQGGTIWTIDFEQYRKAVLVSMIGDRAGVEIFVHMELFGGWMSQRDKEKAMTLMQAFQNHLSGKG